MKIVAVADLHVHPWRLQSKDGGHDRLMDGLGALRRSLELAQREGAVWVFAGDMKQPKTYWPQSALTGVHALLREFRDLEMVMVCGNHDAEGEGGSGLAPFRDVARVVEKTEVAVVGNGDRLVCCPWNGDPTQAARLLSESGTMVRVLVAHGFLQGCFLGPEDSRIAKGTPADAFGRFDLAIFGDVHKAQMRSPGDPDKGLAPFWSVLESGRVYAALRRGTIVYCGSPYQQNWGERGDIGKGALVVDTMKQSVSLHYLGGPEYKLVELDAENVDDFVGQAEPDDFAGCFVRVVLSDEVDADFGELFAEARTLEVIRRKRTASSRRAAVHAGLSRRELLEGYVAARPAPGDQARAVEAGMRLSEDK